MHLRRLLGTAIARISKHRLQIPLKGRAVNPMANDPLLTLKEVCELLKVHPSTVYKLTREGTIPGFRIGSEWRFHKEAIMRWMDQRSREAQQVRTAIEIGANGTTRHRKRMRSRGPKR